MATTTTTTPNPTTVNPLRELSQFGQSAWLDYIRRSLITGGELKHLVDEDGLGGVTSNPAIFEKAMSGNEYDTEIATLAEGSRLKRRMG